MDKFDLVIDFFRTVLPDRATLSSILLWAGFATLYGPNFLLVHDKMFSESEFAKAKPKLAWTTNGYYFLGAFWVVLFLILFDAVVRTGNRLGESHIFLALAGLLFAGMAASEGLFAMHTGVHSLNSRLNFRCIYGKTPRLHRIALIQSCSGLIICILSLYMLIA